MQLQTRDILVLATKALPYYARTLELLNKPEIQINQEFPVTDYMRILKNEPKYTALMYL